MARQEMNILIVQFQMGNYDQDRLSVFQLVNNLAEDILKFSGQCSSLLNELLGKYELN